MGVTVTCHKCRRKATAGLDAIVDWNDRRKRHICDECNGTKRDEKGYAWTPDMVEEGGAYYMSVDTKQTVWVNSPFEKKKDGKA
jgi:hypothetical protein